MRAPHIGFEYGTVRVPVGVPASQTAAHEPAAPAGLGILMSAIVVPFQFGRKQVQSACDLGQARPPIRGREAQEGEEGKSG